MDLFATSGTLDKREFREILAAIIMLAIVLGTADLFGWVSFPVGGLLAPTLEEVPRLFGLGVPLLVGGWIMFAATVKRCRDADFPVALFVALSLLCIAATCALAIAPLHSGLMRQCLRTFVAFAEIMLLMLCGALSLFENLTLSDRPTAHIAERAYRLTTRTIEKKPRFGQKH